MMSCAKHGHEHAGNKLLLLFVVGKQSEYFISVQGLQIDVKS